MTILASSELREYNIDEDTQLLTPEPTPEALIPTPESTLVIVDSPPALDTGKQPIIINGQTDQFEPDESNLVDKLIDTSIHPTKKAST